MKVCVVYYSMSGNTSMVADKIVELMSADKIELMPKKEYPSRGFRKFLWGGKSAVMHETPELEPYEFTGDYDLIIIGSPVWAGNLTPPLNTFIRDNKEKINRMKVGCFLCQSGNGADKIFGKIKETFDKELIGELVLIDPKDKPKEENNDKIKEFCKKIKENI